VVNCGQWSGFLVHDITVSNNKVSSAVVMLKFTGLYLKSFRIRRILNTAECTQRIITRPTFMN